MIDGDVVVLSQSLGGSDVEAEEELGLSLVRVAGDLSAAYALPGGRDRVLF